MNWSVLIRLFDTCLIYNMKPVQTAILCIVHSRSWFNRGSYMSVHVLLKLLNELRNRDKMRGLPSNLYLFRNEFNKFNNTGARMLDSIYHMTLRLL